MLVISHRILIGKNDKNFDRLHVVCAHTSTWCRSLRRKSAIEVWVLRHQHVKKQIDILRKATEPKIIVHKRPRLDEIFAMDNDEN
jgi:hypothetical protein